VHAAVADVAERFAGRCIAVVAHLGVVRALLPGSEPANAEWRRATAREITAGQRPAGCVRPGAH
jgi:broad specificity phosphatase PhoE